MSTISSASHAAQGGAHEVALTLPADERYIPVAALAAKQCAEAAGLGDHAARISLAMEETMGHALEFGYGSPDDTVSIDIARTPLSLRLQVRFRGLPLDMEHLPEYDPARVMAHGDVTGISRMLIEELMDKTAFSILPGGMRQVALEKYLPSKRIDARPPNAAPERPGTQAEYTLRPAVPGDAEGISRLAFHSHGTVLFSEHIYYPGRVEEMLRTGSMVSVVAEATGSGRIVGHGALLKGAPLAQVEELTFGIVDPQCRSKGCATGMVQALEKSARERGVAVITVFAVTSHPYSQRSVYTQGYRECGLILDTSPASHSWGEDGLGSMRIGNVVLIKRLQPMPRATLHVPDRHRDMAARIYAHLGIPAQFAQGDAPRPEPDAETQIQTISDIKEGWAFIGIARYGADALAQAADILEKAKAKGIASIQLFLPLAHPATRTMAGEFEGLGFFFAGLGPTEDGTEGVILQYPLAGRTDYESVHVHSDFARELKDYIRACDPRVQRS